MVEGKGYWGAQEVVEVEGHQGSSQGEESGCSSELVANKTDFETELVSETKAQNQGSRCLRRLGRTHLLSELQLLAVELFADKGSLHKQM